MLDAETRVGNKEKILWSWRESSINIKYDI